MVASRTTPAIIDLAAFDEPLADALRKAARGDQTVQLTDGGRPIAQITPLRPVDAPPPDPGMPAAEAELSDDERAREVEARREWDAAWAARRAMTGPYVFDPVENERVLERRRRLVEQLRDAFPPGTDAVELIREQRRGYWER